MLRRGTVRAEHRMVDMAAGTTRWIGDVMPRGNRLPRGPQHDVTPGLGVPRSRSKRRP